MKKSYKKSYKKQKNMKNLNNIVVSDCFDFIASTEHGCIDLALLDPPYFLNKGEWDTFASEEDFFEFTFSWIDALLPKIKKGGSLYIFNTPYNSAFILKYLVEKGFLFQNWITWDKRDGFSHTRKKFIPNQETVVFFSNGEPNTFNADSVRVAYESSERIAHAAKKGILKNGKRWFPNPNGKLCGDVWHMPSERHKNKVNGRVQKMKHATPKPLDMIKRIIKASSEEGDVVFDCFVGSGTTALASKMLNRNFLCADRDKEFVEMAKSRLCATNTEGIVKVGMPAMQKSLFVADREKS